MSDLTDSRCPACESDRYREFADLPDMPVHVGVLWESAERARSSPRGHVVLAHCERCGFIGNRAFDPTRVDYELRYDNALHFSKTFRDYEAETAERLIARYAMRERRVAEIGCGSGHFLSLLCRTGRNTGIGFDPSFEPGSEPLADGVRILREYYSDEHTEHEADLVCCRHVLEHIPAPRPFLDMIRRSLDGDRQAILYLEVPNAFLVFRDLSIWDVIYEHCNYFSAATLSRLLESTGFEVLDVREPYDGQFLSVEARLADGSPGSSRDEDAAATQLAELDGLVDAFGEEVRRKREGWSGRLDAFRAAGRTVVLWGGGAKAVTFLNLVGAGEAIDAVVDINPGKQGSHIAGTGQLIVPPEKLQDIQPDVVVVMNRVYRDEIADQLADLGLAPELRTV